MHGSIYNLVHTCRLRHESSSPILPERSSLTILRVESKPFNSRNNSGMDGSYKESCPANCNLDRNTGIISVIDEVDSKPEVEQQQSTEDGSSFSMDSNWKLMKCDVMEHFSGNGLK